MFGIGFEKNEKEVNRKIIEIIQKWMKLPHYKVFYFGSRVTGGAGERSDIDIGIDASQRIPGDIMVEIGSELQELPIMQKIDVVDFNVVDEDFKKVALEKIEVIYEQ